MVTDSKREARVRRRARSLGAWVSKDRMMNRYEACWIIGHDLIGARPYGRLADLDEIEAFLDHIERLTSDPKPETSHLSVVA